MDLGFQKEGLEKEMGTRSSFWQAEKRRYIFLEMAYYFLNPYSFQREYYNLEFQT